MGYIENISFNSFPKQGKNLNKEVDVCFHYDTSKKLKGVIVRNDIEEPGKDIIKLEDGRFILSTECQYSLS